MSRAARALVVLLLAATALRAWAALAVDVPWIAPDELIYGLLGRGLWEHGRLEILGGPTPFYSVLYPALVGLPLRVFDLRRGYEVPRVVQAVVVCATAIPVYFWTRSIAREARSCSLRSERGAWLGRGLARPRVPSAVVAAAAVVALTAWPIGFLTDREAL